MVVASFLTKDLHLPWQVGARHLMPQLVDADLASNQHGWKWVPELAHLTQPAIHEPRSLERYRRARG